MVQAEGVTLGSTPRFSCSGKLACVWQNGVGVGPQSQGPLLGGQGSERKRPEDLPSHLQLGPLWTLPLGQGGRV